MVFTFMMRMGIFLIFYFYMIRRVTEFCQKASVEELRAKGAVHKVIENGFVFHQLRIMK